MNILYLTNHLNIGGITSYVLTLSSGIKKKGHNLYVASSSGSLIGKIKEAGITFIPIPIKTKKEISLKIFLSMLKLREVIKKNNIELVHSNSRTTQVLGCLLHRYYGPIHITTCHGFFKTRLSRRLFPCWGQKVIAISESVREHLIKDFKLKPENIVLIHNGIDIDKFRVQRVEDRERKRKEFGLGEGPVVGIIARLSDVKGHIYLIQAMKNILEKLPKAQLLIIGEGKMHGQLTQLCKQLRIQESVKFIPSLVDTQDVLSVMDVFAMPSIKEGLGLSIMEAMASGLAVVASNVGGIRSLITNEVNGLLVEPANIEQLSWAILELLLDYKKAKSLGSQARDYIEKNFSQDKMVQLTEELYLTCQDTKN